MDTVRIRNAAPADAGRILEIYAYYVEHTAISFEYQVPTLTEFQARMKETMGRYPYLVAELDNIVEEPAPETARSEALIRIAQNLFEENE